MTSFSESKWHIELYSKEFDGWIELRLSDFSCLLKHKDKDKERFDMNKLKEYKIVSSDNQTTFEPKVGGYVEFKLEVNMSVELDSNSHIVLKSNMTKKLTMWIRGKVIVSLSNGLYLIEYNNKIYDQSIKHIRFLSMPSMKDKLFNWSSLVYPKVYKYISDQLNNLSALTKEHTYYDYDSKNNFFYVITDDTTMIFIKEIIEQKQEECDLINKYDIEIESEKRNLNKLNMILNSNLKEVLKFHIQFKQSIEKEVSLMNIQYAIITHKEGENGVGFNDLNYFSLILYSKNQKQLDKALETLLYKEEKIDNKSHISISEIESTATKAKLQHFYASDNEIYLLGKEKNINNFKKLWSITVKYNEKIQQTKIESENMKKELTTLKKQYKIK